MNELLPINTKKASITMSSREIAEIVESRHSDVKRSIERLIEKGVIQGYTPLPYTHQQNGQTYYEYHLFKRDTYIVVAQLCPEFTARLVDRWQELEAQQANNAFSIPQTLSQALRLAAEQAEKIEQQEQLIALQAPKAAFVDHYVDVGTSKSLRETAKILKMPEKAMIERLIEDRLLFRQSGKLLPFASEKAKPLFTVKTGTAEHGHNYTQTRVTAEGMRFIAEQYATELML
ncbi:MAG TPA: phage antirepressor KilAC domain-containing protein [Gallibacterium anatis]|uniref:Phage antirepressor KilAC domain-containing protein n=1 Tax=Gallibacterium anatis TaxID=750 RepID=A0A921HA54_9PAST|nr:phage antirepressor KilAC domain-containing protein [Gallibacterium anatis]HJF78079.1 phage antirepressor KilAC domain-containing protein [Enterococcus cecorum]